MPSSTWKTSFFFNDTATTEIYTLSLHDALPICSHPARAGALPCRCIVMPTKRGRSEEHTSELQSLRHLVCRLLLEKNRLDDVDPAYVFIRLDSPCPVLHYRPL